MPIEGKWDVYHDNNLCECHPNWVEAASRASTLNAWSATKAFHVREHDPRALEGDSHWAQYHKAKEPRA